MFNSLTIAIYAREGGVVNWLLRQGIEIRTEGYKALISAISTCNPEIVDILLDYGASPHDSCLINTAKYYAGRVKEQFDHPDEAYQKYMRIIKEITKHRDLICY